MEDKIRKLLTKAEGAATPEEAEIYHQKAMELAAKFGIDAAVLAAQEGSTEEVIAHRIVMEGAFRYEQSMLAHNLSLSMSCKVVNTYARRGREPLMFTVVGHKSDVERLVMIWSSLNLQMLGQARRQRPDEWDRKFMGVSVQAHRKSWMWGFICGAKAKIEAAFEKASQEATGTGAELVLVSRKDRVDQAYASMFPKATVSSSRKVGQTGYSQGYEAGQRADIGTGGIGNGHRTPIAS